MKTYNSLTDDDEVKWEFTYDEKRRVPVFDAVGRPTSETTSRITEFLFVKELAIMAENELPIEASMGIEWTARWRERAQAALRHGRKALT